MANEIYLVLSFATQTASHFHIFFYLRRKIDNPETESTILEAQEPAEANRVVVIQLRIVKTLL